MSLTAADLQKRHALEGAPDPFPSLDTQKDTTPHVNGKANGSGSGSKRTGGGGQANLDTSSEASFPSLGPAPATKSSISTHSPAASGGGGGGGGWNDVSRVKRPVVKTYGFTDSFSLGDIDLRTAGKDGKPTTLAEVIKTVMAKTGMTIEASSQRKTGQTTFLIKGDSGKDSGKAKKLLTAMLSPTVTRTIDAPVSTVGSIIGPKGATLKQIREENQVRVDIPPRKEDGSLANGAAAPHTPVNGTASDDEEEPTITVTVSGPAPLVDDAINDLKAIIAVKAKKTTRRIKDIPAHVLPFVAPGLPSIEEKMLETTPEATVSISAHIPHREIVFVGDKAAVQHAMELVEAELEAWKPKLKSVTVTIPRHQHRLVVGGKGPEELFKASQVVVVAPEQGEGLTLWGESAKLGPALGVVLEQANSKHIATYDLPGPVDAARRIHTYIHRTAYLRTLGTSHPDVVVHTTPEDGIEKNGGKVSLDFVGDAPKVDAAMKEVKELINKLDGGVKDVEVDWLVHKALIGRHGKKIKQFQEAHNVIVFFPSESSELSAVTLVHDPLSPAGSVSKAEKHTHLEDVSKEILKLAADAADVKTETINVDKKWHAAVVGKNGTTLNAVIGEEKSLSIKVGSQAKLGLGKEPLADDAILIRGPRIEVDRAIKEILQIVKNAENDEIDNGYSIDFDISREFVGRIVGAQGSGVNKLRDSLGVRVDFDDEVDDKEWAEKGKGKKSVRKAKVKITGRKENVEEAKKRILSQVDKMADETTEVVRIPRQYHSGLIGSSGKYVIRLEETYGVKITFARGSDDTQENGSNAPVGNKMRGDNLKSDEVMIKGGKSGVAHAKKELLDVVEFEKQNNMTITFNVPTRSISRIVGKGGSSINEIKDNTGAQIDVDKEENSAGTSAITVRGTDRATKDAKSAILSIAAEIGEEVTEVVHIEGRYHRNFIGKGGETLRELITKVGGPADPKQQAGLVHFPRHGEAPDEVRLRGDKALVAKLKKELEKMAGNFRDRVVMGVGVPAGTHRSLIGRGGQHLNDLQSKTNTQIWFPGSRAYGSVGDPENIDSLKEVVPEDLVKVFGSKAACEAAIAELSKASTPVQRAPRPSPLEPVTRTIAVPLKYHNVINQQGNFYRNIRSLGVFVDHSKAPETPFAPTRPPSAPVGAASAARIDQEDEAEADTEGVEWQVIPNYEGAEEGDAEWVLRGRDEESLDSAQKILQAAIDHAKTASHVGFLTLAERSAFPRIVGTKGANVSRIRAETGADVTVGKGDNTIVIVGSEDAVELAKAAILQTVQGGGGKGPRKSD